MILPDTLPAFNILALTTNQEGQRIWSCMGQYLTYDDLKNIQSCSKKLKIPFIDFQAKCERATINNFLDLEIIKVDEIFQKIKISDFDFRVSNEFKSIDALNRAIMIKLVNIFNAVITLDKETWLELKQKCAGWKYIDIFNHDFNVITLGNTFNEITEALLQVPFFTDCQKKTLYEKAFGGYMRTFGKRGSISTLAAKVPDKRVLKEYFKTKKPNFDAKVQGELDKFINNL
jgi:hypothetical protein